jgi:hypothetical protein
MCDDPPLMLWSCRWKWLWLFNPAPWPSPHPPCCGSCPEKVCLLSLVSSLMLHESCTSNSSVHPNASHASTHTQFCHCSLALGQLVQSFSCFQLSGKKVRVVILTHVFFILSDLQLSDLTLHQTAVWGWRISHCNAHSH